MLRDTKAGSIRSSSSNSRSPWLEVPVSGMGAERSGTASSVTTSQTTTSVLASGCGSTRASALGLGAIAADDLATGSVAVASIIAVSMVTASGIIDPLACTLDKINSIVNGGYNYSPQ
jgi:hypothetical protein